MTSSEAAKQRDRSAVAADLVEISRLDTLYRDIYLTNARRLMKDVMPYSSYSAATERLDAVQALERQIRAALQTSDWERAKELAAHATEIRQATESPEIVSLARSVYDELSDIPVDPFAVGFYTFFNESSETARGRKARALDLLSSLELTDPEVQQFYARRRADIEAHAIGEQNRPKDNGDRGHMPEALKAVESGDLTLLADLIQKLDPRPGNESKARVPPEHPEKPLDFQADFHYEFSDETVAAARALGMSPVRTPSRRHLAVMVPYAWTPSYLNNENRKWAKDRVSRLTLPGLTSNAAREAIELYLFNPLINSGGTRYQVCLVEEDLLIEDFEEPSQNTPTLDSRLLQELGLSSRRARTRVQIEEALLSNGTRVVENVLKLDPDAFRLVAIPPDIFTILGPERGWGRQETWTHFDGYWVQENCKLQALAGGDKRFGGTHDVVCFDPTYTSDKLIARFAVVQRKRMRSWQQG